MKKTAMHAAIALTFCALPAAAFAQAKPAADR